MFDYELFRKKLREHREKLNMTIEQLSEKSDIDVNTLARIEIGLHKPKTKTIVNIFNALNMTSESFFNVEAFTRKKYHISKIGKQFEKLSVEEKKLFLKIINISRWLIWISMPHT